jgi:hypothetical protein
MSHARAAAQGLVNTGNGIVYVHGDPAMVE